MEFREIRNRKRALSESEARRVLAGVPHGVLATAGKDGWPYAVPLNHVLAGNDLYVHCALEGHKIENILWHDRVSYCAIASAQVLPENYSTLYESAIAFGRASLVTDPEEKRCALKLLVERFCGQGEEQEKQFARYLEKYKNGEQVAVIRIRIERLTGKAHRPASA